MEGLSHKENKLWMDKYKTVEKIEKMTPPHERVLINYQVVRDKAAMLSQIMM